MSEDLNPWESKVRSKLEGFRSQVEVTDEKVGSFFEMMDEKEVEKSGSKLKVYWRIAAILVLGLVAVFVVFQANNVHVDTGNLAGKQQVVLPDGTSVMLRFNTTIAYNKLSWRWSRELSLEGEAFFEVIPGSTFTVSSDLGKTTVVGTSFNIQATDESYEVRCFEGKVRVESSGNEVLLEAGNGVKVEGRQSLDQFDFNTASGNWHQAEVFFEDEVLSKVIEALARTYNRTIVLPEEFRSLKYTGFFPTDDLNLALRLVLEPLDLEATFDSNQKIIISKASN